MLFHVSSISVPADVMWLALEIWCAQTPDRIYFK